MGKRKTGILESLRRRGFDRSRVVPFERGAVVGCSQCEAVCINGVACHEIGCPNRTAECEECGDVIPHWQRICESCMEVAG